MKTKITLALFTVALLGAGFTAPAHAQQLKSKVMEKTSFYNAPRQVQILDDRPTVRDFRTVSEPEPTIELPQGPHGSGIGVRNSDSQTLPAGGLSLGSHQGYRTPDGDAVTLPKSGFGQTNIPARGMGPVGSLPDGKTTNRLAGHSQPPHGTLIVSAPKAVHDAGDRVAPAAHSYAGPASYGNSYSPVSSLSSNRTESMVRGSLLGHR
jgi:hypothetical protein